MEFDRWLDNLPETEMVLDENESVTTSNRKLIKEHLLFSDLTVLCGEESIPCHRFVLAEYSLVLRTMLTSDFREGQSSEITGIQTIEIKQINPCVLKQIVDFFYIRLIDITKDNFDDIVKFSDMYEVLPLKMLLAKYVMNTCVPEVSWMLLNLSRKYRLDILEQNVIEYILPLFNLKWLTYQGFLELEKAQILKVFSHPDLHIAHEWQAFVPLLKWVINDQEFRGHMFSQMLSECIRVGDIDMADVVTIITRERATLLPEVSEALLHFQKQINGSVSTSKILPCREITGQSLYIAGKIDKTIILHIYKKSLAPLEIQTNMNNPIIVASANTTLYIAGIETTGLNQFQHAFQCIQPSNRFVEKIYDLKSKTFSNTLMKGTKRVVHTTDDRLVVAVYDSTPIVRRFVGETMITLANLSFNITEQTYIYGFEKIIYFVDRSMTQYYTFDILHKATQTYITTELGDIPDNAKLVTCSQMACFVSDEYVHIVLMDELSNYHQSQRVEKSTQHNDEVGELTKDVQHEHPKCHSSNLSDDEMEESDTIIKLETADKEEFVFVKRFTGPRTGKKVMDATVLGDTLWVLVACTFGSCTFSCANVNDFLQAKEGDFIKWNKQQIQTGKLIQNVQIGTIYIP